jgi:8-hydroxy-5-deazaflavin:NADPH oxidoreductase
MGYKSLVCLNVGIVGGGRVAEALASGFAKVGHNVFIGRKGMITEEKAGSDNITYTDIGTAAGVADVLIMTLPMDEVREVAYMLGDIRRKVIVDVTSFSMTRFGQYVNTASVLKSITGCQHIVKCYNKTGYEELVNEELVSEGVDVFVASDSRKGKEIVKLLAKDLCLGECYDFGGNEVIKMLDEMSICWHNRSVKELAGSHILFRQPRA